MDKEKLRLLSEDFTEVERRIYELGSELHRLSCHMENIRYSIMELLKEAGEEDKPKARKISKGRSKKVKEAELPLEETPVVVASTEHVLDEVLLPAPTPVPEPAPAPELEPVVEQSRQRPLRPTCSVPMPTGTPIKVRYSSVMISNEFEFSDTEYSKSNRSIYVIEEMTDTLARFYPISDKANYLLSMRVELIDPACVADRDLSPVDFNISEEDYGLLKKNAYGRWDILKKCSLLH